MRVYRLDIETVSEQGDSLVESVDELRKRAAEAVISANVDPSLLTAEQHRDVDALQALAAHAATEANLVLLAS